MDRKIKCDASNCIYHDGECTCTAKTVNVDWAKNCNCKEAKCSTFKPTSEF